MVLAKKYFRGHRTHPRKCVRWVARRNKLSEPVSLCRPEKGNPEHKNRFSLEMTVRQADTFATYLGFEVFWNTVLPRLVHCVAEEHQTAGGEFSPLTVIGIPLRLAPGGVITMRRMAPSEMLAMYSGSRFSSFTIVDLS